ncbi:hypothetical protein KAJ83_01655 [Marivibrio halodurans]|uniref:Uncharacterized protein n=1 Tax=Marivibrio halodurans TaxID=2039722 RepID=A0A8J7SGF8_9PROT|nr:hypothetical protein [Marivibrio halodurans]MBP5855698.1 hypothetical protein [Marivibrio halodurans]
MPRFIRKLLQVVNPNVATVDNVMASFSAMITDLKEVGDIANAKAEEAYDVSDRKFHEGTTHYREAARAQRMRVRLSDLIDPPKGKELDFTYEAPV